MKPARDCLLEVYATALAAVHGKTCVQGWLQSNPLAEPVALLAVGKAACAMTRGASAVLGPAIVDALIITKRGYGESMAWPVIESGHPLPDAASVDAGLQLEDFIARIPASAVVLVLLSGGASALLERLPAGITLKDLQRANQWLLAAGLDIHTMNAVRKRLSRIKGGRLAQHLYPRTVTCLAISDVPGDDPGDIGSGLLSPDRAALDTSIFPAFLQDLLAMASPPAPLRDAWFQNVRQVVLARNADARAAAASAGLSLGFRVEAGSALIRGDAVTAGRQLAATLLNSDPGVLHIWGGETTVNLPPHPGRGGRCQSLALAAAEEIAGRDGVLLLAAGTDGSDGPGEDAGAVVDGGTLARGQVEGLTAGEALARADAGRFLEASGDLIQTGPTGTNVMDLMLGLRLEH